MRRNYPRRTHRDPAENYDVIYDNLPERQNVSCIINHPRKLITINLCANPYIAMPEEVFWERTRYEDELED